MPRWAVSFDCCGASFMCRTRHMFTRPHTKYYLWCNQEHPRVVAGHATWETADHARRVQSRWNMGYPVTDHGPPMSQQQSSRTLRR